MKLDDAEQLFGRWFSAALSKLRELDNGDGAIAGLMIVLPLFERYVHIKKSQDTSGKSFYELMADELNLPSKDVAEEFWTTFRHGFCHTGMPFVENKRSTPLPGVSFRGDFPKLPEKVTTGDGKDAFKLDPWKFIQFVEDIYTSDPTLLDQHGQAPLLPIHTPPR